MSFVTAGGDEGHVEQKEYGSATLSIDTRNRMRRERAAGRRTASLRVSFVTAGGDEGHLEQKEYGSATLSIAWRVRGAGVAPPWCPRTPYKKKIFFSCLSCRVFLFKKKYFKKVF